ncbi:MAG: LD-carboxypeptidase [Gemmatimonadetes bacterium]|nr:MAG: LD-carboxypeptidase [Gemmatimonadota bacterium]
MVPRLQPGSTIGVIAPSGVFNPQRLQHGLDRLRQVGDFTFRFAKNLGERTPLIPGNLSQNYEFSGSDPDRIDSLHTMFADEEIEAIFCVRGGHGVLRILDQLDYDLIRSHPKILMGFSDITALLLAIHQQCDFTTFHGPMIQHDWGRATSEVSTITRESFQKLLVEGTAYHMEISGHLFRADRISGQLIGGNLAMLTSLLGTPFFPDVRGKILFLEDVNEHIYKLDRMLHHLRLANQLNHLHGIIWGQTPLAPTDHAFLRMIADRFRLPVAGFLPFGHAHDNVILPLGGVIDLQKHHNQTLIVRIAL